MNESTLKRVNFLALPESPMDSITQPVPTDPETCPAPLGITWQTLSNTFLAEYRGTTERSYHDAWKLFLAFCGIDLKSIVSRVPDEDLVKAYRDTLLDTGHSPHTINAYLSAVRAFYRFLHSYIRKALRTGNISASRAGELQLLIEGILAVRKVRTSNAPGRLPTTVDQSRDLLTSIPSDTLTDIRDRAMVALILGCGLRRIEIARTLRSDLIHQGGQLLLRIQQKGHHAKDAWVVIWPDVERILRPWLTQSPFKRPDDPLFPSLSKRDMGKCDMGKHDIGKRDMGKRVDYAPLDDSSVPANRPRCAKDRHPAASPSHAESSRSFASPLTPRSISRIVRKRLDVIGLKDHSTHSLRHAFATIALSSDDVELRDVQHALGHSQITTTERYIHQSNRLAGLPEKAVNDIIFAPLTEDT